MSELWATGALSHRPYFRPGCFQPLIDANVTATVEFDASLLEANSAGIRNTPDSDQDVAAIDTLLACESTHHGGNLIAGSPAHAEQFGLDDNLKSLTRENAPNLLRDIEILRCQELRTGFDDGHIAAKAAISLCQLQTGITPAYHDQMPRQIIKLQNQPLAARERSELPRAFQR